MPGIAGVFSTAPTAANELGRMVSCLLHEPSYTSGQYNNPELGCHVGWTSHRGSFCDGMPQWNDSKDICLVFSGEDFTDREEIAFLLRSRHAPSATDASYLIRMYEELGASFLTRLNGWFSGVLFDLRTRKVILFNDRYGVNRLYWKQTGHGLYFASEAKALLRLFPDSRYLDTRAVAESFSLGCVLQDRTLFSRAFAGSTGVELDVRRQCANRQTVVLQAI